ncbi:integrase arm-type DNA-binding domain-containing protein [Bradyrhizobium sp. USDA 3364]
MREARRQARQDLRRKCPGLYVSIIPAGVATFYFKFTDPSAGKQRTVRLGVYNPETFATDDARSKVYALKALDPAMLVEQMRQTKAARGKHGKTVAKIIEARIDWMKQDEVKEDGEKRSRSRVGRMSLAICDASSSRA